MSKESKAYELPKESLPTLGLSEYIADITAIKEFFESRGISTKNTRIERYAQCLEKAKQPYDAATVFKNAVDPRFKQPIDWHLYVLREIHDLMWILKGLRAHVPEGVQEKLKLVVGGTDFSALDTNTESRNVQFELRIASYFCQAGCKVDLSKDTDVIAVSDKYSFYVECKRVTKVKQLQRRLKEGVNQLNARMPENLCGKPAYGLVAADVTKAGYNHDGLTWALTPEHSKDVIQKKLFAIGDALPQVEESRNILQYWLQIHIPALVVHPPIPMTRFSSYFLFNINMDWGAAYAWNYFDKMIFRPGGKPDSRCLPAQKLQPRKKLTIPAGTHFWCEPEYLKKFITTGEVEGGNEETIIASMEFGGKKHEFTIFDLQMLAEVTTDSERAEWPCDFAQTIPAVIIEMFWRRYPYQDSEKWENAAKP